MAAALIAVGAFADIIVLKDGSQVSGRVSVCDEEVCLAGGQRIPLEQIARIELSNNPNAATAATPGSIILTDGTVRQGTFTGLNIGYVWIGDEEIDRNEVAAIILAPAAGALPPSTSTGGYTPPASTPPASASPAPGSGPQPSPAPRSSATAAPPPSSDASAPPGDTTPGPPHTRGALWKGLIVGRLYGTHEGSSIDLMAVNIVRLREWNIPMMIVSADGVKSVGRVSKLWSEESVVRNWITMQIRGGGYCSGDDHALVTTTTESPQPSVIYTKNAAGDMQSTFGFDVPTGKQLFVVGATPHRQTYEVTCRTAHGAERFNMEYFPVMAGRSPLGPSLGTEDPELRYVDAGKMVGGYTVPNILWRLPSLPDDFPLTLAVGFAICREGVECPPPPEVGEGRSSPGNKCAEGTERDFAQTCENQLGLYCKELMPLEREHTKLLAEADKHWPAFKSAALQCGALAVLKFALEKVLAGPTKVAKAAEGAGRDLFKESVEAANAAVKQFEGIIAGDSGDFTSPLVSDAEANFYPWKELKKGWKLFKQGKQMWDLYHQAVADPNAAAGSVLEMCTGLITPETHLSAEKFLDFARQAGELHRTQLGPRRNEIDRKVLECLHLDYRAWRACRDVSECRGEPPAQCGVNPYDQYEP